MPGFPATPVPVLGGNYSVSVIDAGGDTSSVPLPYTTIEPAQLTRNNVQAAIGDLSNAAVYKDEYSRTRTVDFPFVTPLDEAHSGVNTTLNLVFINPVGDKRLVAIPAPDLSYFGPGGSSIITPDSTAIVGAPSPAQVLFRSITRIIAYFNEVAEVGHGDYRLSHGYKSKNRGTTATSRRAGRILNVAEPIVGQLPQGAPDDDEAPGAQDDGE